MIASITRYRTVSCTSSLSPARSFATLFADRALLEHRRRVRWSLPRSLTRAEVCRRCATVYESARQIAPASAPTIGVPSGQSKLSPCSDVPAHDHFEDACDLPARLPVLGLPPATAGTRPLLHALGRPRREADDQDRATISRSQPGRSMRTTWMRSAAPDVAEARRMGRVPLRCFGEVAARLRSFTPPCRRRRDLRGRWWVRALGGFGPLGWRGRRRARARARGASGGACCRSRRSTRRSPALARRSLRGRAADILRGGPGALL